MNKYNVIIKSALNEKKYFQSIIITAVDVDQAKLLLEKNKSKLDTRHYEIEEIEFLGTDKKEIELKILKISGKSFFG